MKPKDQLLRLFRIQELAMQANEAEKIVAAAPVRIEEIEGHFRERNAEYVAIKERHDLLDADQRNRSLELKQLEIDRQKFMDDLMQVKNQREYAAILKEIDTVKARISEHEEAILQAMDEVEKLTVDLATHEEHIAKEREAVARERAEVEAAAEAARRQIEKFASERASLEEGIPQKRLATLRKLETTRAGVFLSKAENGTCQSCYVRIRPQVFQEIKLTTEVHTCSNCRRFLYHEPSLGLRAEAAPAGNGSIEAVNGGAV